MSPLWLALAGGLLIGLATALLMFWNGRTLGVSGILAGVVRPTRQEWPWRASFLLGMLSGGVVLALGWPALFDNQAVRSPAAVVVAGLLVGVGTRLGGGCTSGHGLCGLGIASRRSLVAVVTFMAAGALMASVVGRFFGGRI